MDNGLGVRNIPISGDILFECMLISRSLQCSMQQ